MVRPILLRKASSGVWRLETWTGRALASVLPKATLSSFVQKVSEKDLQPLIEALGPRLNRKPDLDTMPFDLPIDGNLCFEHLVGLFASTPLDHAVITMSVRQSAYMFDLIKRIKARKIVEIGRYKGGSTLLLAAAMEGEGKVWSIDIGEKESRLYKAKSHREFDDQLRYACQQLGLNNVELIVGDSRSVEIETGEVDLVLIDGDHSFETAKQDFDKFGRRVRLGGAVLMDDAFDDGMFRSHPDTVGRIVREAVEDGEFELARVVNHMAHLKRVSG